MNTWRQIPVHPIANPQAIVRAPNVRFTVLTSRLIRMEYSAQEDFEDRPSQVFWHREQPVPSFTLARSRSQIEILTQHLHLRYRAHPKGFTADSLSIELIGAGALWHYGDRDPHHLHGTARTLDRADGPVRLAPGLMSRSGWAVIDDSTTCIFDAEGWLEPRRLGDNLDLYFFGYGHDYLQCLKDFCQVSGAMPLIPRWALENWWSRYWEYSQDELTRLTEDFKSHQVPLSVCVVDMDWHLTQTGNASGGWTGYTWNRALFPDPERFIHWLHDWGLKVTLNLHPADGVYPHEAQYVAMCERLGIDPKSREPVRFNIADPKFAEAYFEILHHPLERQGVDFWWIDWQQGEQTEVRGLDPLWWLNHLHYFDLGRDRKKRPFIFSRWGGLGNHRYPIGSSGDTYATWKSLAFQPHFTATAANVGYAWWSHDIGGHQGGVEDPELYTRWVQCGVFSPILRLHSTKNPYHERRPWGYDAEVFRVTREAMQLRHALIPYLYAIAWKCFTDSRPLILPMYYLHPEEDDAYQCPNQYYFGSELVAAPYVSPRDPDTRLSRQTIWLPAGDWFDFFTGEYYPGSQWQTFYGGLDEIPVLAKAGGIIPIGPKLGWGGISNPTELTVFVFPGANGYFELYEDDGETQAFQDNHYSITALAQNWHDNSLEINVAPARGDISQIPSQRTYTITVRGIRPPDDAQLLVNDVVHNPRLDYAEATETLMVSGITLKPSDELRLRLSVGQGTLLSKRDRGRERCRRLLRAFRLDTETKYRIDQALDEIIKGRVSLMQYRQALGDAQLSALSNMVRGSTTAEVNSTSPLRISIKGCSLMTRWHHPTAGAT